jgi:very-short-patch-repair endonuclease
MSMKFDRIDGFASTHHGLISRPRAEALGVSTSSWYRAIAAQVIEPIHPNVARLRGSPETFEQRALAAVWGAGRGAVSSHRTSASLWNVSRPASDPIDLILPARTREARLNGVVVHRPVDLMDLRPIIRRKIPTTNPMRMLLDLGAVDQDAVFDALIEVLASKVASPASVRRTMMRHAKKGRHGVGPLRLALERWLGEELPPDSALEAKMAEFITRHQLPAVTFHAVVMGYEVDFLISGTRIVLECDGWGTHGLDRDQFEFDRVRNGELTAAGYIVVHFTWRQLTTDPESVAVRILENVQRWAPGLARPRRR